MHFVYDVFQTDFSRRMLTRGSPALWLFRFPSSLLSWRLVTHCVSPRVWQMLMDMYPSPSTVLKRPFWEEQRLGRDANADYRDDEPMVVSRA